MLGHRPGDAQPVEGRRAAADLVEHDQAARGGAVEDVRGLLHLDHEGRLAARDVVRRADARVDAIDQPELGVARRHERAGLGQQRQQRDLTQVRRLAAHVRPGEHDELLGGAVERARRWARTCRRPAAPPPDGARRWPSARRRRARAAWCSCRAPPFSARPASTSSAATRRAPCRAPAADSADTRARSASNSSSSRSSAALVGAEHLLLVVLQAPA